MNAEGPKHERETIIRFDEEADTAEVWTAAQSVYRRLLKRLGRAYLIEDGERHAVFSFPRKWVVLPRFREVKELDPTQRSKLRKQLANHRQNRASESKKGVI